MPCTASINSTNADRFGLKARYLRLLDSLSERARDVRLTAGRSPICRR